MCDFKRCHNRSGIRERHPYVAPLREAIYNKCFIIAVIFPEKTEWLAWLFDQGGKPVQDLFIERTEQIKKTRRWFLGYRLKGWHAIFNKINREFYKR